MLQELILFILNYIREKKQERRIHLVDIKEEKELEDINFCEGVSIKIGRPP